MTMPESVPDRLGAGVAAVLAGDASYDDLPHAEQAVVRSVWTHRIKARREALNFATEFQEAGLTWTEADAAGNVIHRS